MFGQRQCLIWPTLPGNQVKILKRVTVTCITYAQIGCQVNIYNFDFCLYINIDQPFNSKPSGGIQAWIRGQNNAE